LVVVHADLSAELSQRFDLNFNCFVQRKENVLGKAQRFKFVLHIMVVEKALH